VEIKQVQEFIKQWHKVHCAAGDFYDTSMIVSKQAGQLSALMVRRRTGKVITLEQEVDWRRAVEDEIGDVIVSAIATADKMGVDASACVVDVLGKLKARPVPSPTDAIRR
jgi:hypothetical protein